MSGRYEDLSDEEVVEELKRRMLKVKELLREIRDLFKEMR